MGDIVRSTLTCRKSVRFRMLPEKPNGRTSWRSPHDTILRE